MKKSSKKVLVVDDDPNIITLLEKWLNNAGYTVLKALNGEVGIDVAKSQVPDLILLDLMLPGLGGIDVVRKLKKDSATRDIPVILITVTMGVELDKGDETMDVDGCQYRVFAKPLHNMKLLSEIRKSINRRIHGNTFEIQGS